MSLIVNTFYVPTPNVKMKLLFFIMVACASILSTWSLSEDEKQLLMNIQNACLTESGVSLEIVQKMMEGEFIEDEKLKEHLICFAKKEGLMSDSGDVVQAVLEEKIHSYIKDEAKADEIVSKCAVLMATSQDTAFHFSKCMIGTMNA